MSDSLFKATYHNVTAISLLDAFNMQPQWLLESSGGGSYCGLRKIKFKNIIFIASINSNRKSFLYFFKNDV
jgi:hypothetical protein